MTLAPPAADRRGGGALGPMAVERTCLNCGAPVASAFCPACGQRVGDPDPTLREIAEEFAGEMLHWDGKLWTTLKTLVRHPGELTLAYVAGKRASYVGPLRLYLTASVLYFFIASVAPDDGRRPIVQYTDSDSVSAPVRRGSGLVVSATRTREETAVSKELGGQVQRRLEHGVQRAARDPKEFGARIRENLGLVVFLVLPAFAFAVSLAYRGQRRHFPQHLVFALHVHALAFLLFSLSALTDFSRVVAVQVALGIVALCAVVAYIVVALRRVYGGSWPSTVAKAMALGVVYFVFYVAGNLALALYSLLT